MLFAQPHIGVMPLEIIPHAIKLSHFVEPIMHIKYNMHIMELLAAIHV